MILNDLKISKTGFLMIFANYLATHILTVNCTEITKNKFLQAAYESFSIKRKF